MRLALRCALAIRRGFLGPGFEALGKVGRFRVWVAQTFDGTGRNKQVWSVRLAYSERYDDETQFRRELEQ